jgi:tetratricopeptide (TPR) repeat protein
MTAAALLLAVSLAPPAAAAATLEEALCSERDPAAAAAFRANGEVYRGEIDRLKRENPDALERLRACALETGVCVEKNADLARRTLAMLEDGSLSARLAKYAPERAGAIERCARAAAEAAQSGAAPASQDASPGLDALFDGARARTGGASDFAAKTPAPAAARFAPGDYDPGRRASELFSKGAYAESIRMSDEALARFPNSPYRAYWLVVRGAAASALDDRDAAARDYRAAAEFPAPNAWCADARLYLGLLETACSAAALEQFDAALACPERLGGAWVRVRAAGERESCKIQKK